MKEKHLIADLPAQAQRPLASQRGTATCPQVMRAPSDLHSSAHPAPDVLTPHCSRHSLRQLHSWPSGLWDSGPANSPGKEGKEGTPQTNSKLPEPKHTLVRGLSRQAGQRVGLTLSLPAQLQGVRMYSSMTFPCPLARCPCLSTIPADSPG